MLGAAVTRRGTHGSVVLLLLGSLLVVGALPAHGVPTGTVLAGLSSHYAMYVVPDGRIFVSEGFLGSDVAVLNADGVQTGTLTNIPSPAGITAVDSTLYVAAFGASAIYRFDLSTDPPTQLTSLSTSPLASPRDLAHAGGRLWFTSECNQFGSHLGSMALNGSDVQETAISETYCTKMEWSRWAPDRIFIHNSFLSSQTLVEYDVSSGAAVFVSSDSWPGGSFTGDSLSVTPDGLEFLIPFNLALSSFDIDDMIGPTFTYDGIAHATDTSQLEGGLVAGTYATSVRLWRLGQFERLTAYELGAEALAVAFSSDGALLYALSGSADTRYLTRFDPTQRTSTLTLRASSNMIDFGRAVTLTAHLDGGTTNRVVELFGTRVGGTRTLLDSKTVGSGGNASFRHRPTAKTTYQVEYGGDDDWIPAESSNVVVLVKHVVTSRMIRFYRSSGRFKLYHETQRVFYETIVKPPHPGSRVRITLQFNFGSGWQFGGSHRFEQNNNGKVVIYFSAGSLPRGRYRLQSDFGSDVQHVMDKSPWAYFKVTA